MSFHKSFLHLQGCKTEEAFNKISSKLPKTITNNYVELFGGIFNIWLNIECEGKVFLNDINRHTMNCLFWMKKEPDKFGKVAKDYFVKRNFSKERYYELKEDFNSLNTLENAAKYPLLTTLCNGKIQFNKQGDFSSSFWEPKNIDFLEEEYWFFVEKLNRENVFLFCGDFKIIYFQIIELLGNKFIVYLDPPYLDPLEKISIRWQKRFYHRHSELQEIIDDIIYRNGTVILSNSNNNLVKSIYNLNLQNIFSYKIGTKKPRIEMLYVNNPI